MSGPRSLEENPPKANICLRQVWRYSDITMIDSEDYLQYLTGYLYSSSPSRPILPDGDVRRKLKMKAESSSFQATG